jgi:hypothetical protein
MTILTKGYSPGYIPLAVPAITRALICTVIVPALPPFAAIPTASMEADSIPSGISLAVYLAGN